MNSTFSKKRVGIFGGSFDPPHKGHQYVVDVCLSELQLDQIYLIPSFQTPSKDKAVAVPEDRLQMVSQVFQSLPQVQVLDLEIKRKGVSYTKDTLKELGLTDEVFLILGEDAFLHLCDWQDCSFIMESVYLVVFMREAGFLKKERCPAGLVPYVQKYGKNIWHLKNGRQIVFFKSHPSYYNLSSTQIKNKIRLGLSVDEGISSSLHGKIQNYYKHLSSISAQRLHKDVGAFLKDKGALDSQLFCFDKDLYEYILITSGLNTRHVRSLFISLKGYIKKTYGIDPYHIEGEDLFQWVVMDYGFLIIHIFYDYLRDYYQLEDLWKTRSK